MEIAVKLQMFEGPLGLLLHLIEKNKIDIYDIPIADITDQYLDYVRQMEQRDLNSMSEFMVMAATLIDMKCRMLLPAECDKEGEEEDPRDELVARLLEYRTYQYMSGELRDRMQEASRSVYRPNTMPSEVLLYRPEIRAEDVVKDHDLAELHRIFQDVMRRREDRRDPVRSRFGRIEKEEISLDEEILFVKAWAQTRDRFSFRDLLRRKHSRMQLVVTFLVVLELIKSGEIRISQDHLFDDIRIEAVHSGGSAKEKIRETSGVPSVTDGS